jgi:hypothetical protein
MKNQNHRLTCRSTYHCSYPPGHNWDIQNRFIRVRIRQDAALVTGVLQDYDDIIPEDNGVSMCVKFHSTTRSPGTAICHANELPCLLTAKVCLPLLLFAATTAVY